MSQARLKKILILLDLAQKELDKSLETLGFFRNQLSAHEEQLASLQEYLQSYIDKINNEGMCLMPIQLQTTQTFIDKLNTAIYSQTDKVEEQSQLVERAQQAWLEKRARLKAFQTLYDKIQKDLTLSVDRHEQKMLDDLASQQFIHKTDSR